MTGPTNPVGRAREMAELTALVDEARHGHTVSALVVGESGAGKTALVRRFAADHPGRVRVASAAPWESGRRYGVVGQLFPEGIPGAEPDSDTDAVDVALGILDAVAGDDARADAQGDGRGGVAVPDGAAETTVLLVDDAHHADVASLRALSSSVTRGQGHRLVVLWVVPSPLPVDVSSDVREVLVRHRADSVEIGRLGVREVALLVSSRTGLDLSPWMIRRLHEHTGGSPRSILQLLGEIPRTRWASWRGRFPAPRERASEVRASLARTDAATRALVEAAAVLGDESSLSTTATLAGLDDPVAALDGAVHAGLLIRREDRGVVTVAFDTPMTRAAVADDVGPSRWQELHRSAAALVADEGAALAHLVAASGTADEELAQRLENHAAARADDGAWSDAADALVTASRITPDRAARARRLVKGVDAMTGAADLPQALLYLPEIEDVPDDAVRNAVLGYLAIQRGRAEEASYLLSRAWDRLGDPARDPQFAATLCQRMVLDSLARLDGVDLVAWADRASALVGADTPAAVESLAIRGLGLALTGRVEEARTDYELLAEHIRSGAQSQRVRMARGWLLTTQDEPDAARIELEGAEPTVLRGGSLRISLWAQAWLARTQFALGAWDSAMRTVQRASDVLDRTGVDLLRPLVHWTGAQVQALRGNRVAAREQLRLGRAGSTDYPIMSVPAAIAAAQVAEVDADYPSVLRHLASVASRGVADEPGFWPWPDLYANALVMTGQVDRADEFLAPHERTAAERGHRSAQARLGYVRGRILGARGDVDAAQDVFEWALDSIVALPLPYDRARISFAYGQTLRRAGRRRDADAVIRTAREEYAALGAVSLIARCDRELNAGGVRVGSADTARETVGAGDVALTPQERAVAALVASGRSNREVAGELFISVKTVQYHLTRIYAKYGIRSRSELAAIHRGEL